MQDKRNVADEVRHEELRVEKSDATKKGVKDVNDLPPTDRKIA